MQSEGDRAAQRFSEAQLLCAGAVVLVDDGDHAQTQTFGDGVLDVAPAVLLREVAALLVWQQGNPVKRIRLKPLVPMSDVLMSACLAPLPSVGPEHNTKHTEYQSQQSFPTAVQWFQCISGVGQHLAL